MELTLYHHLGILNFEVASRFFKICEPVFSVNVSYLYQFFLVQYSSLFSHFRLLNNNCSVNVHSVGFRFIKSTSFFRGPEHI
jgi:hypothetical protein